MNKDQWQVKKVAMLLASFLLLTTVTTEQAQAAAKAKVRVKLNYTTTLKPLQFAAYQATINCNQGTYNKAKNVGSYFNLPALLTGCNLVVNTLKSADNSIHYTATTSNSGERVFRSSQQTLYEAVLTKTKILPSTLNLDAQRTVKFNVAFRERRWGCTTPVAINFDPNAEEDDGSCIMPRPGCTDTNAINYDPAANVDDGSCVERVPGCTQANALNYDPAANVNDGSCVFAVAGCMDSAAANFNPLANQDDGSCSYARACTASDSDCDGVLDSQDSCLGTQYAVRVNAGGCADMQLRDDDGDGIANYLDSCVSLPPYSAIAANGCSENDLADHDNDGVVNHLDLCAGSISGSRVGMDGCPLTASGGADLDADGVLNAVDSCPNTAFGDLVDSQGCAIASSNPDNDGDGVPDHRDACPASQSASNMSHSGCSLEDIANTNSVSRNLSAPLVKPEVDPSGKLTFSYPIEVPIAGGGTRPNIALSYRQGAGLSWVGFDFAISGLLTIERCLDKRDIDGRVPGSGRASYIDYCLNGGQLVTPQGPNPINGKVYYRAAEDDQSEITRYEISGISYFDVRQADGTVHTLKQSDFTNFKYYLERTVDAYGNTITYSWHTNASNALYLYLITWGKNSNAGTEDLYALQFNYQQSRFSNKMVSGTHISTLDQRLTTINLVDVGNQAGTQKTWQINYHSRANIVASIEECIRSHCFTGFSMDGNYAQGKEARFGLKGPAGFAPDTNEDTWFQDLDRDGTKDYIYLKDGELRVAPGYVSATGDVNFAAPERLNTAYTGLEDVAGVERFFEDIDGDGYPDHVYLLESPEGGSYIPNVITNNGQGHFQVPGDERNFGLFFINPKPGQVYLANVAGDYLPDLVWVDADDEQVYYAENNQGVLVVPHLSDSSVPRGTLWVRKLGSTPASSDVGDQSLIDMDNNGYADWVYIPTGHTHKIGVAYATPDYVHGVHHQHYDFNFNVAAYSGSSGQWLDINADGLIDRFWVEENSDGDRRYRVLLGNHYGTFSSSVMGDDWQARAQYAPINQYGINVSGIAVMVEANTAPFIYYDNYLGEGVEINDDLPVGLYQTFSANRQVDIDGDGVVEFYGLLYGKLAILKLDHLLQVNTITDAAKRVYLPTYSRGADIDTLPSQHADNAKKLHSMIPAGKLVTRLETRPVAAASASSIIEYEYHKLMRHWDGLGDIGFEKITKTDTLNDRQTTTYYNLDPSNHLHRTVSAVEYAIPSTGWITKRVENTYQTHYFAYETDNKHYLRKLIDRTETFYKPDGTAYARHSMGVVPIANDDYARNEKEYLRKEDLLGNSASIVKESTFTYAEPDLGNWILNRRSRVEEFYQVGTAEPVIKTLAVHGFDRAGRSTSETLLANDAQMALTVTYVRDHFGNTTKVTRNSPSTSTETIEFADYDHFGRYAVNNTNALGHRVVTDYDYLFGEKISEQINDRFTTHYRLDQWGQVIAELAHDGNYTTTEIIDTCSGSCSEAYFIKTVGSMGGESIEYFDNFGRLIKTREKLIDGEWSEIVATYDAVGLLKSSSAPYKTDATGNAIQSKVFTHFEYDQLRRVTRAYTFKNDGFTAENLITYDGLSTIATLPDGRNQTTVYDAAGQVTQVVDNQGNTIDYTYQHPAGPATVTVAGKQARYDYDLAGNIIYSHDHAQGETHFTYDGLSRLTTTKDANGVVNCFAYDAIGRLVKRVGDYDYTTSENVNQGCLYTGYNSNFTLWHYDNGPAGRGFLTAIDSEPFDKTYHYDHLGRERSVEVKIFGKAYQYTSNYNANGQLAERTFPNGYRASYRYSEETSDLVAVLGNGHIKWQLQAGDVNGRAQRVKFGNGIAAEYDYDHQTGMLQHINYSGDSSVTLPMNVDYEFDTVNNVSGRFYSRGEQSLGEETFQYDALNRLSQSQLADGRIVNHSYDDFGSIVSKGNRQFTYNELHSDYCSSGVVPHGAITSMIEDGNSTRYCYDKAGNQTHMQEADGDYAKITYSWFNKPVHISKNNRSSETINYGPDYEVIQRTSNTENGQYVYYNVDSVYQEVTTPEGITHKYFLHPDVVVTESTVNSVAVENTLYLHRDNIGSVINVSDQTGTLVDSTNYDPWGEQLNYAWNNKQSTVEQGFSSHSALEGIGLVHMGGRVYNPKTSQFLSPDPVITYQHDLQNHQRYSYVINNPLSITDPTGFSLSVWSDNARDFFANLSQKTSNGWRENTVGKSCAFDVGGCDKNGPSYAARILGRADVQQGLRITFAVAEITGGIAMISLGASSGFGVVVGMAGVYNVIHGIDVLQAAIRKEDSYIIQGYQAAGLSRKDAIIVDTAVSVAVDAAGGFATQVQKAGWKYSTVGKQVKIGPKPKPKHWGRYTIDKKAPKPPGTLSRMRRFKNDLFKSVFENSAGARVQPFDAPVINQFRAFYFDNTKVRYAKWGLQLGRAGYGLFYGTSPIPF